MTDETTPSPQILEPEVAPEIVTDSVMEQAPPVQSTQPPSYSKKKNMLPFLAIPLVIIVILVVSMAFSTKGTLSQSTEITVTPTPTTAPVSTHALTSFATTSAFMQYSDTIDGLPKLIQGAVLQDPTILPPVLDLPLGF